MPVELQNTLVHVLTLLGDPVSMDLVQRIANARTGLIGGRRQAAAQIGLFDDALLHTLVCVTYRDSSPHVRRIAVSYLRVAARERGISRNELEDQLAPTCALDVEAPIDYGSRQFQLVLGNNHTPLVRESSGRLRTSLPRSRRTDMLAHIGQSHEHWHWHKRSLALASRVYTARFEQSMIEGRRWSPAHGEQHVFRHPLLGQLARRILWGGYRADGTLDEVFCIAEDGSLVNERYQTINLGRYSVVGIPHPVAVDAVRRGYWTELLSDFHVAPLFPQAGRTVHMLDEHEHGQTAIVRFQNAPLRADMLPRVLNHYGWVLNHKEESASYYFGDLPFLARLTMATEGRTQRIVRCGFEPLLGEDDRVAPERGQIPLLNVEPAARSEILCQLTEITANPKHMA